MSSIQRSNDFFRFTLLAYGAVVAASIAGHYSGQFYHYLQKNQKLGENLLPYVALQILLNVVILYIVHYICKKYFPMERFNIFTIFTVILPLFQPNLYKNIHQLLTDDDEENSGKENTFNYSKLKASPSTWIEFSDSDDGGSDDVIENYETGRFGTNPFDYD